MGGMRPGWPVLCWLAETAKTLLIGLCLTKSMDSMNMKSVVGIGVIRFCNTDCAEKAVLILAVKMQRCWYKQLLWRGCWYK